MPFLADSTDSGFVSNRSSIPADSVDSRVVSVNPLVTVIEKEESTLGETDETKKVAQMEQKLLKFTLSDLMKLSNAELVNVAMCLVGAQKAAVRNFSKEGDPVKFLEYIPRQIGSVDHSNGNRYQRYSEFTGQSYLSLF